MSFALITDSAANLPQKLFFERKITVLSYEYTADGETGLCYTADSDYEERGREFYHAMRAGRRISTSLINCARLAEAFEEKLEAGEDVLFVSLSSGISGTYRSAVMAAEEMTGKYPERKCLVLDTLAASLGEGLLVLLAADLRDAGEDISSVYDALLARRGHIRQEFTVDDLAYLRRGGRISAASMLIGTLLHVKPLLRGNEEGKIVSRGKVQGKRRALDALAASMIASVTDPTKTIGIAHADCPEDADYLLRAIRSGIGEVPAIVTCYDLCTGAHVGPGTVALFWEAEHR